MGGSVQGCRQATHIHRGKHEDEIEIRDPTEKVLFEKCTELSEKRATLPARNSYGKSPSERNGGPADGQMDHVASIGMFYYVSTDTTQVKESTDTCELLRTSAGLKACNRTLLSGDRRDTISCNVGFHSA